MLGYRIIVVLRQMLASTIVDDLSDIGDFTDADIQAAREFIGLGELGAADFCLEYETEAKSGRGPDIVYSKNGKTVRTEPAVSTRVKHVSLLPKERKVKKHKLDGRRKNLFGAMESQELEPDELARRLAKYQARAEQGIDLFG